MTDKSNKPVWFCDIDGVINRLSPNPINPQDTLPSSTNTHHGVTGHLSLPSPSQANFHWNEAMAYVRDSGIGIDGDYKIRWATEVVDFINRISHQVEFIWLTSWGHMAEKTLVPLIGLNGGWTEGFQLANRIPERHGFQTVFSQKILTVEELTTPTRIPFTEEKKPALYTGRPIIWTDDHLSAMIAQKTEATIPNSLVITPWSSQGLTQNDLNLIEEFVAKF